jgi:hypothetical protein
MGLLQDSLSILKMFYENMYRTVCNERRIGPYKKNLVRNWYNYSGSGSTPLLYLKRSFSFFAANIKFYQQRPWVLKSINASDLSTAGACEIPSSGWGRLSAS